MEFKDLNISLENGKTVSALFSKPTSDYLYVFGHGAGAGMRHAGMSSLADSLGEVGIGTLRYQFPYMEAGRKMPDCHPVLEATVLAAIRTGKKLAPKSKIIIGGRSMGGRMSTQALAHATREVKDVVAGIIFMGFPLHKVDEPDVERAEHLKSIDTPMLFVQGTADAMCEKKLLLNVVKELKQTSIHWLEGADHSFKVRGGKAAQSSVYSEIGDTCKRWVENL